MTYRVVTSHLVGGITWGYLPDDEPQEYETLVDAVVVAADAAAQLRGVHEYDPPELVRAGIRRFTVTWEQDGYPRGRRFEVVEHA